MKGALPKPNMPLVETEDKIRLVTLERAEAASHHYAKIFVNKTHTKELQVRRLVIFK
jgi:hypothetical protein